MMRFWKKNSQSVDEAPSTAALVERFLLGETDLVRISGPEDGSCVCGDWVGAVVSVNGNGSEWPPLVNAIDDGVFHPKCRHILEEYNPSKHEVEGRFCSELATHNYLARKADAGESGTNADSGLLSIQAEFEKLYEDARRAEQEKALEKALSKCEAALEILNRYDVYSDEQKVVENALESRIRRLVIELDLK